MRSSLKRAAKFLVLLAASPLILAFALLILPWALLYFMTRWVARVLFCRKHRGKTFLVVSPRRGWREFVENNVTRCCG